LNRSSGASAKPNKGRQTAARAPERVAGKAGTRNVIKAGTQARN